MNSGAGSGESPQAPQALLNILAGGERGRDEAGRQRHVEMGFHEGRNTGLDQLFEVVSRLRD